MTCRILALLLTLAPLAASADGFQRMADKSAFLAAVQGRSLTGTAIRLTITPDGQIAGRAFGTAVTGSWTWQNGYFCRTLDTAVRNLPLNCQLVETDGTTVRFTADKGRGDVATLRIK